MTKSVVSIAKGTNPAQMVQEVLTPLGGVKALIRPKLMVVIKPNGGHMGGPEYKVHYQMYPMDPAAARMDARSVVKADLTIADGVLHISTGC